MIRNIVFDMGGVLREWDPERFLAEMPLEPEERALLMCEIFRSVEWPMQDIGLLTESETLARVCRRLPGRLHETAEELVWHWERHSRPVPGMAELIGRLKANGYGIYLLSNASRRHGQYWGSIPGSEYFDGLVISAFEGILKPDLRMYETLLARFSLKANECFFTDDLPVNVAGALAVGMDGAVFTGADALERILRERGVSLREES